MQVLLDRKQHLIGVDRLYDVVGYLRAYGLVHDVLLLALGDHYHGRCWAHVLYQRQRFQPRHAGHHLVEDDKVVCRGRGHVDRVVAVVACVYLVAFGREEHDVGFEKLDLVVDPEYLCHSIFVFAAQPSAA